MADSKMIELSGLWEKTKGDGTKYWTGNLNANCRILIFPNSRKTEDRHPDFRMYIAPNDRQQQGGEAGSGGSGGGRSSQRASGGGGRFNQRRGDDGGDGGGDDGGGNPNFS